MYDSHPLHFMIHGPSNRITLLTISICKDDYRYTVLGNLNDKRILYPCGITISATGTELHFLLIRLPPSLNDTYRDLAGDRCMKARPSQANRSCAYIITSYHVPDEKDSLGACFPLSTCLTQLRHARYLRYYLHDLGYQIIKIIHRHP